MQNIKFIPQIIFQILKILQTDWPKAFSKSQSQQNPKGNCGTSFKTKKAPIVGPNFSQNRYC